MKNIFKKYLFDKNILVNDAGETNPEDAVHALFAFANLYNIKITQGEELALRDIVVFTSGMLEIPLALPFYQNFSKAVKNLTKEELLFDQLIHYAKTYGLGDFSAAGHSVFEEQFERLAFKEKCKIKEFVILTEEAAEIKLLELVGDLLKSTRPLNDSQYEMICEYIDTYGYEPEYCENKDTAIRLILDRNEAKYAKFITLADIIKVLERLQYDRYKSKNIKKLNLRNKDRKLLKGLLDAKFTDEEYVLTPYSRAVKECYEKQALWAGFLHHIHYEPVNDLAEAFVKGIRSGKNISVLSEFEQEMNKKDVQAAAKVLAKGKGSAAVLRKLNYLLSRCQSEEDICSILSCMETKNPIVLIQLLLQYAAYKEDEARRFKFTKFNKLRVHTESFKERQRRQSVVPKETRDIVCGYLEKNLKQIYKNRLGKVYIDPAMKKIALPLQENTSMGGYGVLPKGSRLPIPVEQGKKVRAFTYWEKVNDIDLSVIGMGEDGNKTEFSWRTMWDHQSDAIAYSGDQTSGYNGGTEYFDIDLPIIREMYPDIRYMVFCDNVFSGVPFKNCLCKAGYMLRDIEDSGEVYEPKTVESSFIINCDSTFAYLFAIDLQEEEFIWLNAVHDSREIIAGRSSMEFLLDYMNVVDVINTGSLLEMMASELVEKPEEADLVVSNKTVELKEGAEQIRFCDVEKVLAYMNI